MSVYTLFYQSLLIEFVIVISIVTFYEFWTMSDLVFDSDLKGYVMENEIITLKKYMDDDDSQKFWRLSSGQHENLLDEAIEEIEHLNNELGDLAKSRGENE